MKALLFLFFFTLSVLKLSAQTQGITYQAVLVDDNDKEIPGVDVEGNYLPNQALTIRFSIIEEDGALTYQEEHHTSTDKYGMINVIIGWGESTALSPGGFMDIDWDGLPKNLSVEISLGDNTNDFSEFSAEPLTFVPYAYHRNITATGTMRIDDVTDLNGELNVNNGSATNLSGNLTVELTTDLNGNLNVNNASPTYLSGTLDVDENTNLNAPLNVNNGSATNLSGNLIVEQETDLNGNLSVHNNSATLLTGDLTVEGETTVENINLQTLNSVSDQASFVASFENTNSDEGDGIRIKLGKRATKNNQQAIDNDQDVRDFVGELSEDELNSIKGILDGDLSSGDVTYLAQKALPTPEDATALAATVCELTLAISNELINFLNNQLHLPATIGPYGVSIAGVGYDVVPKITLVPKIPAFPNFCSPLGTPYEFPDFRFDDIADPLNNSNVFIEFVDNDDFTMGAIKAQSIEEWTKVYLDPVFVISLVTSLKGMDKSLVKYKLKETASTIAKSYLAIGVQYSSGNGDYAEWLERKNPGEVIGAGDIVGVGGGKITKDLTNAEQVMAVSHHPIVLGNTPDAGREHLGNNVAFMGQIPVKIMGPVHSGDYIVGKGDIPGYGIAVSPDEMTLEDFKNTVGRSWEDISTDGPKMVNTVVGIHNGNYVNLLKQYDERVKNTELRIQNLEEKFELLLENNAISNK